MNIASPVIERYIEQYLKITYLRIKMGKKRREIILNRFTWDKVVDKIVKNIYV